MKSRIKASCTKDAVLNTLAKAQLIDGIVCNRPCSNCGMCLVRLKRFFDNEILKAAQDYNVKQLTLIKQTA